MTTSMTKRFYLRRRASILRTRQVVTAPCAHAGSSPPIFAPAAAASAATALLLFAACLPPSVDDDVGNDDIILNSPFFPSRYLSRPTALSSSSFPSLKTSLQSFNSWEIIRKRSWRLCSNRDFCLLFPAQNYGATKAKETYDAYPSNGGDTLWRFVGSGAAMTPFTCHCERNPAPTSCSVVEAESAPSGQHIIDKKANSFSAATSYQSPSKIRKILASLHIVSLPVPRILLPDDYPSAFDWQALRRGLKERAKDEARLRQVEKEAREAAKSGDSNRVSLVASKICEIAYGEGVTPQMRQDFLIKYGCAAWNDEALSVLFQLGAMDRRGILEVGAGNGQWARALTDYYRDQQCSRRALLVEKENDDKLDERTMTTSKKGRDCQLRREWYAAAAAFGGKKQERNKEGDDEFEFVLAYDDGSSLPLSPIIYHSKTQPAHDHFYSRVRKGSHLQAVRSTQARGRVLLLVFPPPGPMATETVLEYIRVSNTELKQAVNVIDSIVARPHQRDHNDTLVYIGEGRGGANADDSFFDLLEAGNWALLRTLDLPPSLGSKGFEKMFILRRVGKQELL